MQTKKRDQQSCKICNKRKQQKLQNLQQRERERERERERARKIANFAKTKERTKQFATKKDGESC